MIFNELAKFKAATKLFIAWYKINYTVNISEFIKLDLVYQLGQIVSFLEQNNIAVNADKYSYSLSIINPTEKHTNLINTFKFAYDNPFIIQAREVSNFLENYEIIIIEAFRILNTLE